MNAIPPHHDIEVTVAFELAAIDSLLDPHLVYDQTQGWAAHVGIVSDQPTHVITDFARRHQLDIGFHSGPRDVLASLARIRAQPELAADRYVLIGTDAVDADRARELGWAFLPLHHAAQSVGWRLRGDHDHVDRDSSWL